MEEDKEKLKAILEEDFKKFDGFIQETKKHKMKMLNPKVSSQLIASVSVNAYIKALAERLGIKLCGA